MPLKSTYAFSTFSLMNIAGLKPQTTPSKVPFIEDVLKDQNQLFMCLTETWLKRHTQAELAIDGYKLYRSDRMGRIHTRGRYSGGAALYLRQDIAATSEQLLSFSNGVVEALVTYSQKENLLIAVVYRQPDTAGKYRSGPKEFNQAVEEISETIQAINGTPDIIITGDFNLPGIVWNKDAQPTFINSNPTHKILSEFQNKFFLSQRVDKPTHSAGNILDLVMTNNKSLIDSIQCNPTRFSDHLQLEIATHFKSHFAHANESPRTFSNVFSSLNFFSNDTNWLQLKTELEHYNWTAALSDIDSPDEQLSHFISKCESICADHVPMRRQAAPSRKSKIPRERRVLMRRRTKVAKQLAKHQPPSKTCQLKNELVEIELKLQDSHNKQLSAQEKRAVDCIKNNPKYFYSYVKRFSKSKASIGPLLNSLSQFTVENEEMASLFSTQYSSVFSTPKKPPINPAEFFNSSNESDITDFDFTEQDIISAIDEISNNASAGPDGFPAILLKNCKEVLAKPLYTIWRNSLDKGVTPSQVKQSTIVPIHKGNSTAQASNYRPVALTSHLVKIFEKILRKNIIQHLEMNNLLNPSQHGFRAGRSCLSQLIAHYDKILELLDNGANVDVIYLDFAKAFDKLDFTITLEKLKALGINGRVGQWLHSFLTDRVQAVVVNGAKSQPAPVISGVPQGSVIGPLLFLILIGDIDKDIFNSFLSSFADDTRIGRAVSTPADAKLLQDDLNHVFKWAEENNMLFNDKKFEIIRYGNNTNLKESTNYVSNTGTTIQPKDCTKDLGVIMSNTATFKDHIAKAIETARDLSSWILRSFKTRSKDLMLQLWKTMVIPRLDYCSQLWNPHQSYLINQLEDVQKFFVRNIAGFRHKEYTTALKELRLYSLQRRRERYQIIYLWSIIEGMTPNIETSNDILVKVQSDTSSRLGRRISTRPLRNSRFSTLRFNSLPFNGARLFNSLPKSIRNTTECAKITFKVALDSYLWHIPDLPMMLPYSQSLQVASNSLLHTYRLPESNSRIHCRRGRSILVEDH